MNYDIMGLHTTSKFIKENTIFDWIDNHAFTEADKVRAHELLRDEQVRQNDIKYKEGFEEGKKNTSRLINSVEELIELLQRRENDWK